MPTLNQIPPNPTQFSWFQAYWCGGVASLAYLDVDDRLQLLKDSYPILTASLIVPADPLKNRLVLMDTGDYLYIGVEGTARSNQWAAYLYRMYPVERAGWPGYFPEFFSWLCDQADEALSQLPAITKPVVLCGHSLGGAVAALLAYKLKKAGVNVVSLFTYGSTRPASAEFSWDFDIAAHRLVGNGDPVPHTPPSFDYCTLYSPYVIPTTSILSHVGNTIDVGDLDISEIVGAEVRDLQNVSMFRSQHGISAHYLGSYQEAIWVRLTPEERGQMLPLFNMLDLMGKQGVPNFPLAVATPEQESEFYTAALATEENYLESLAGPESPLTFHLFTGPANVPASVTPATFAQPSYPGYSPARLEPIDIVQADANGGSIAQPQTVRFDLESTIEIGVEVLGVFAQLVEEGSPAGVVAVLKFPAPRMMKNSGDTIDFRVEASTARVS